MPKKTNQGQNVVAFRVTDEIREEIEEIAAEVSQSADGVEITRSEMAKAIFMRGLEAKRRERQKKSRS